jgi:hypothetical protein
MIKRAGDGVFELELKQPIESLPRGRLEVSAKDRQGNTAHVDRNFSIVEK